jgi:hypothetical protein
MSGSIQRRRSNSGAVQCPPAFKLLVLLDMQLDTEQNIASLSTSTTNYGDARIRKIWLIWHDMTISSRTILIQVIQSIRDSSAKYSWVSTVSTIWVWLKFQPTILVYHGDYIIIYHEIIWNHTKSYEIIWNQHPSLLNFTKAPKQATFAWNLQVQSIPPSLTGNLVQDSTSYVTLMELDVQKLGTGTPIFRAGKPMNRIF